MENSEKIKKSKRDWNKRNPIRMQRYHSKFLERHPDYYKEYGKKYYLKNKKRIKKYYQKNRQRIARYRLNNKEKRNEYEKEKRKKDIDYRIRGYLRNRLNEALKNNYKISSMSKLLGCTISELKNYLAEQFKNGMNWDNYGRWHIDHIVPCCKFDLSRSEEQKKCFHHNNLQPLWAKENLSKFRNKKNFNKEDKKCL